MSFALDYQSKSKATDLQLLGSVRLPFHKSSLAEGFRDSAIHLQEKMDSKAVQEFMHFSEVIGFDFGKIGVQRKLKVSQPGDDYEQEADRIAEQVTRIPVSGSAMLRNTTKEEGIDRKCSLCEIEHMEEQEEEIEISRRPSNRPDSEITHQVTNEINNIRSSGGSPLDASTKEFMESRLGYDFSKVRIHTDERAADSCNSVNALAYAVGNDIVFGQGQYRPGISQGRELLAHELAHTIQQRGGTGVPPSNNPQGIHEMSARMAAQNAVNGQSAQTELPVSGVGISMQPVEDEERKKALAEVEALSGRIDQLLSEPDEDDSPPPKMPQRTRSCPGGALPYQGVCLTDEVLDALPLAPGDVHSAMKIKKAIEIERRAQYEQAMLIEKAVQLAHRDGKIWKFCRELNSRSAWENVQSLLDPNFRKKMETLHIRYDEKDGSFTADPNYVLGHPRYNVVEPPLYGNFEAISTYNEILHDLLNPPEGKGLVRSALDPIVHWVCKNTEPCSSNMELFHKDLESGMSRAEAINRGMARLTTEALVSFYPTPGPRGPIALPPGRTPTVPFEPPIGTLPKTVPTPQTVPNVAPRPERHPVGKSTKLHEIETQGAGPKKQEPLKAQAPRSGGGGGGGDAALRQKLSQERGKSTPATEAEADSLLQAIDEGKIDIKDMTPDRPNPKLGEPDHDFVLRDSRGRAAHYADIKTPIKPKLRPVITQASDIATKIKEYGPYGKGTNTDVIIDLKNLDKADQGVFLGELQKNGVDLNRVTIINKK